MIRQALRGDQSRLLWASRARFQHRCTGPEQPGHPHPPIYRDFEKSRIDNFQSTFRIADSGKSDKSAARRSPRVRTLSLKFVQPILPHRFLAYQTRVQATVSVRLQTLSPYLQHTCLSDAVVRENARDICTSARFRSFSFTLVQEGWFRPQSKKTSEFRAAIPTLLERESFAVEGSTKA